MKIIILVQGGVVQEIKADEPGDIEICVLDQDNRKQCEEEDEPGYAELETEFDAMEYWPEWS